jgi:hypothetical protein
MKHDWAIRLLVRTALALAAPIMGIAEVSAQVDKSDVFRLAEPTHRGHLA